jgi:putative hydrolase of the HAD superfamily
MSNEKGTLYQAILFDLGWTLIYPSPTRQEVIIDTLDSYGYQLTHENFRKGSQVADKYYQSYRWDFRTTEALKGFWITYYRILLENLEEAIKDDELVFLIEKNVRSKVQYYSYSDTIPLLTTIKQKGWTLGMVSNWSQNLHKICKTLGLEAFFDVIVVSDIVGWHKPQPQIFELALEKLKIRPNTTLYVGDDYIADILGAQSVGIIPIHIDRKDSCPYDECIHISSLGELIPIIESQTPEK